MDNSAAKAEEMATSENGDSMFFVYMVECKDGTLYTGWTTDIKKREEKHNSGTGAKYTRSRLPVKMIYWEEVASKSEALKRERAIKKLGRGKKLELVATMKA